MIGEPDAGKPHVRFDEGTQETGGDVPRLRPTLIAIGSGDAIYRARSIRFTLEVK